MPFLTDRELVSLLSHKPPPILNLDLAKTPEIYSTDSQIQPCSVDLTIGTIFQTPADDLIREADDKWKDRVGNVKRLLLEVGSTVRVETAESFSFVHNFSQFGAILSPPARVSRRGLLLLDLGHVDPGFQGPVRTTIVNLGREPAEIHAGMMILTALVFRIEEKVHRGYRERIGTTPYDKGGLDDVRYLSPDFMALHKRTRQYARAEIKRTQNRHEIHVALVSALIAFVIAFASYLGLFERRLSQVQSELARLSGVHGVHEVARMGLEIERLWGEVHGLQRPPRANDEASASTPRAPRMRDEP